jgi:hypothetical protein
VALHPYGHDVLHPTRAPEQGERLTGHAWKHPEGVYPEEEGSRGDGWAPSPLPGVETKGI